MDLLYTIAVALVTIGVLVTIHEFGHFWVARRCGVRVLRFSVGFGRPLWRHQGRDGTEYVVAAIPLGGYVKMLDEREAPVDEAELSGAFNRKPVTQRIAIVAAGPLANFLLAIGAYWLLYSVGVSGVAPVIGAVEPESIAARAGLEPKQEIVAVDGIETPTRQAVMMQLLHRLGESGEIEFEVRYPGSVEVYQSRAAISDWLRGEEEPDLLGGLGMRFWQPPVVPLIDEVLADSPAQRAGLESGDLLRRVDGSEVDSWEDWVAVVRDNPGEELEIAFEREGRLQTAWITPERQVDGNGEAFGRVGVSVQLPEWPEEYRRVHRQAPWLAWQPALEQSWTVTVFTLQSIQKMIAGLISPKNLSGPITIAKVASDSAKSGFEAYVSFLALLSISLGVLNLLPIPVLDGGHLMYYLVELVKGSPVSERVQMVGYQIGLVVLLGVMVLAFYNDLTRL
jgi:regulator of sigma E protease